MRTRKTRMPDAKAWVLIIAGMMPAAPAQAIVNGRVPTDNRFDAVGSVSGTRFLDGTQSHDDWWGGATLISPRLVVTARHVFGGSANFKPEIPGHYSVRFRRHPDGTLQHKSLPNPNYDPGDPDSPARLYPFAVRIMKWIMPPTESLDIIIGVLEHEVTHIAPIPVSLVEPEIGPVLLAGWGSESTTAYAKNPRNQLLLADSQLVETAPTFIRWPSAWSTTPPGSGPNMHDSGGAVLLEGEDGALAHVGCITTLQSGIALAQFDGRTVNGIPEWGRQFGEALQGVIPVHTVTYEASGHGWIDGDTIQNIEHGEHAATVIAIPNPGCHFIRWSDGPANPVRQDLAVRRDFSVTAIFAVTQPSYTVTFQTDGTIGATLNGGGATVSFSVPHGGTSPAVTAYAPASHTFSGWSGEFFASMDNPLQVNNVVADLIITASFFPNWYAVMYGATPRLGGAILNSDGKVEDSQLVLHGQDSAPVTAVAAAGYRFFAWDDGVTTATRQEINVTDDFIAVAIFLELIPGDLNGDGRVDGTDMAIMLSEWGNPGGPADLNGDGIVDGTDFAILLANWTG